MALALSNAGTPISVLGLDACLMAYTDGLYTMAPLVQYDLASQEYEGRDGWQYTRMLDGLSDAMANGRTLTAAQLGGTIVGTQRGVPGIETLSALQAVPANVTQQISGFVDAVLSSALAADWTAIINARNQSPEFGKRDWPLGELRDLANFMVQVSNSAVTPAIGTAAQQVFHAQAAANVAVFSTASVAGVGLGIYMPGPGAQILGEYSTLPFAQATGWDRFLEQLVGQDSSSRSISRDWAEGNDFFVMAFDCGQLVGPGHVFPNLTICPAEDVDHYRFSVAASGEVSVSWDTADVAGIILDGNGTPVVTIPSSPNNIQFVAETGRHFVLRLFADVPGGAGSEYTLVIDAPSTMVPTRSNSVAEKAAPIELGAYYSLALPGGDAA